MKACASRLSPLVETMPDRATTVPPDTGVPSGASTYPLTPGSSTTGGGCAPIATDTGATALTSRSNRLVARALWNAGGKRVNERTFSIQRTQARHVGKQTISAGTIPPRVVHNCPTDTARCAARVEGDVTNKRVSVA